MAIHDLFRVIGRKLNMIQPVCGFVNGFLLTGFNVKGKHFHGNTGFQALVDTHFFCLSKGQRLTIRAYGFVAGFKTAVAWARLHVVGVFCKCPNQ